MIFENRRDAGQRLAAVLKQKNIKDPYVLALPRGGVPVAHEVAKTLNAPLDIVVVRKLGVPSYPELGFGAIASNGSVVLNNEVLNNSNITRSKVFEIKNNEQKELMRRLQEYKKESITENFEKSLNGKTALIIDDGMATGVSAKAAIKYIRTFNPSDIIIAIPVCSPDAEESLKDHADEVISLYTPMYFSAVSQWYKHFPQTTDKEVIKLLNLNHKNPCKTF